MVPRRKTMEYEEEEDYDDNYSCCPPPLFMLLVSAAEIGVFVYYGTIMGNVGKKERGRD